MVNVRYLSKKGDEVKQLSLQEAKSLVTKEIDKGSIVYDEETKRMIQKATLNQIVEPVTETKEKPMTVEDIKEDTNVAVFPAVYGG